MKYRIGYILIFLLLSVSLYGQFISEILEYRPAPGQFINLSSTGTHDAALSITGPERGLVSLGSAGGYIVFRFEQAVVNHPDHPYGVDFTLFGNPLPEWSEPGMVYVMKDENRNGFPDDTWYILAGSDYFFSTTNYDHQIIYYEPDKEDSDIPWENNTGQSGFLLHNSFHKQSYYPGAGFDASFYKESCQFEFTRIWGNLDPYSSTIKSYKRAFGFADNRPSLDWNSELPDNPYTTEQEGYGGDAFDLSWAVDDQGRYIDLDSVHFVKVQTSMYGAEKAVGEISTELTAGRLCLPSPGVSGENRILVIEDPPSQILQDDYQLRAYYFENGRYVPDAEINWEVVEGDVDISPSGLISLTPGMAVSVKASLAMYQDISKVQLIKVTETTSVQKDTFSSSELISIWPNPASGLLNLEFTGYINHDLSIQIKDIEGRLIMTGKVNGKHLQMDVSGLEPGIYIVDIPGKFNKGMNKFIKL